MKSPQNTAWSYRCFSWKSYLSGELFKGKAIYICWRYLSLMNGQLLSQGWIYRSFCLWVRYTLSLSFSYGLPTLFRALVFTIGSSSTAIQSLFGNKYRHSFSLAYLEPFSFTDFVLRLYDLFLSSLGFEVFSVSRFLGDELIEKFAAYCLSYIMFSRWGQCYSLIGLYRIAESLN